MTQTPNLRTVRPTSRLARVALAAVVTVGFATGTSAHRPADATPASSTVRAAAGSDGWSTATPDSMGMDPTALDGARAYAFTPERHTQGVVVVRGGKIVNEWYAPGEGPDSWAASWSVGKSFASTLIGIAIDQGKIANVDVPMTDYFPEWVDTPKAAITLRDVLHMESGLKWNEDYDVSSVAASDVIAMGLAANELDYAASRPLANPPGTVFNYSSGDAMLLSGVIAKATGMPADAYARQVLYDPLGIQQVEWWRDADSHTLTYCCNDTTSRNFARLGLLFLNKGDWNGTQVVPSSWVHDATDATANSGGSYGYMWWLMTMPEVDGKIYVARGFDGQYIYVIPTLDLVVVRNGDYGKSACPPVADPTLFGIYPPSGLSADYGTRPPESWSDDDFLRPIVQSVVGPETGEPVFPGPEAKPTTRDPSGQKMAPCPFDTPAKPGDKTPAAPVKTAAPAVAIEAKPTFTG